MMDVHSMAAAELQLLQTLLAATRSLSAQASFAEVGGVTAMLAFLMEPSDLMEVCELHLSLLWKVLVLIFLCCNIVSFTDFVQ